MGCTNTIDIYKNKLKNSYAQLKATSTQRYKLVGLLKYDKIGVL